MNCGKHALCTGKHSGKWRIGELCPLAQEKRRASWRAYDWHLGEAANASHIARFGDLHSSTAKNPDVPYDMRYIKRQHYKYMRALRKRALACRARAEELRAEFRQLADEFSGTPVGEYLCQLDNELAHMISKSVGRLEAREGGGEDANSGKAAAA